MNAYFLALLRRKAIEDAIVELDEVRQEITRGPRVSWVVAGRQSPFGKVHDDMCGAGVETGTNVFLTFVDDILLKLFARIPRKIAIERIEQIHHGRRNYRLMKGPVGHFHGLFHKLAGIEVIVERAASDLGQLSIVPVGKDREVLAPGRHVITSGSPSSLSSPETATFR
jgi:hypothetical protein